MYEKIEDKWCNVLTVQVIKKRIRQNKVIVLFLLERTYILQWC